MVTNVNQSAHMCFQTGNHSEFHITSLSPLTWSLLALCSLWSRSPTWLRVANGPDTSSSTGAAVWRNHVCGSVTPAVFLSSSSCSAAASRATARPASASPSNQVFCWKATFWYCDNCVYFYCGAWNTHHSVFLLIGSKNWTLQAPLQP